MALTANIRPRLERFLSDKHSCNKLHRKGGFCGKIAPQGQYGANIGCTQTTSVVQAEPWRVSLRHGTQHNDIQHNDTQDNGIRHNNK
jgi:hypothetical protein